MELFAWQERWIWDTWGTINGCQWLDRMSTGKVFWGHPFQHFHVEFLGFPTYILFRKYGAHMSKIGRVRWLSQFTWTNRSKLDFKSKVTSTLKHRKQNKPEKQTPQHLLHIPLSASLPPTKTTEAVEHSTIESNNHMLRTQTTYSGKIRFQKKTKQSIWAIRKKTMDWNMPSYLVNLWCTRTIPNCFWEQFKLIFCQSS